MRFREPEFAQSASCKSRFSSLCVELVSNEALRRRARPGGGVLHLRRALRRGWRIEICTTQIERIRVPETALRARQRRISLSGAESTTRRKEAPWLRQSTTNRRDSE